MLISKILVHKRQETGDLAVVGVFFELGAHNDWLENFFQELPTEEGQIVNVTGVNPYAGLPEDLKYLVRCTNYIITNEF